MTRLRSTIVVLLFALTGPAFAQGIGPLGERFARATITENSKPLLSPAIFEDSSGNLIIKGAALATVIGDSFRFNSYQVVDAPAWVYQTHLYDIEAVPPPRDLIVSDRTKMLSSLLHDRFKLRTHYAMRQVEMLVLDRDPVKQRVLALKAMTPRVPNMAPRIQQGKPLSVSTQSILAGLRRRLHEPVLDLTGGHGIYVDSINMVSPNVFPEETVDPLAAEVALLAQTGVILERRTVWMSVLVVTGIERPELDVVDR